MIQKFDNYRRSEKPDFILCNPDNTQLAALTVSNTRCALRYNDTSEISFSVNEGCGDGYDFIATNRQILVDGLGYFIIDSVEDENADALNHGTKNVNAKSCQYELGFKIVDYLSGVYPFYDSTGNYDENGNPTTFMGYVLSLAPGWEIEYVDSALESRYRSLEIVKQTLLDVLYSAASEAYQCIFNFDFLNRKISVDAISTLVETDTNKTDIYLSFDNLIDGISIRESADDIKTKLYVYGQDLDIRQVNPCGTAYIIDLDYYKNTDWMEQDLIDAVNAWEDKIKSIQAQYTSLLTSLRKLRAQLTLLENELTTLEGEKAELDNVISAQIEQGLTSSEIRDRYSKNLAALESKEEEIAAKKTEIKNKISEIDSTSAQMQTVNSSCKLENNLTEEQLRILNAYLIEGEYSNNNYIVTDLMTAEDIQDSAQELYEEGLLVAHKMAQPAFTLSVEAKAFIHMYEFLPFTEQLNLGCMITVEKNRSTFYVPILLEMEFSWDDKEDYSLSFGNRFRLDDASHTYEELLGNASNTSTSVSATWESIVDFERNYKDAVSSLLNNAFNVALHSIISSNNQDIVWDASGFTCRKYDPSTGTYGPEQFKIINNKLVFTDDGWNTIKTVLGKIALEDGSYKFGLAAEAIIGTLLAGNNLVITNEAGTFRIDEKGVSFVTTDENGNEEYQALEDYISGEVKKLEISIDGVVETYYQEEKPYPEYEDISEDDENFAQCEQYEGDLWYSPESKQTYRYTKEQNGDVYSFVWKVCESDVPQEMWDIIDGKKTIYTECPENGFAKDDIWLYNGVPDNCDEPYDSNGKVYLVNDILVATADSEEYNPALWVKYNGNIDKENGSFEFHLNDDGMTLKNGSITMENKNNKVLINPEDGIKILKGEDSQFWADADGNLHLAGSLEAATGTFIGEITGGSINIGNGTFKVDPNGRMTATSGTFKGVVQASDFLDSTGESMLEGSKFAGKYLDLCGIDIGNGSFVVDDSGNVTVNGKIIMGTGSSILWGEIDETGSSAYKNANSALSAANIAAADAEDAYNMAYDADLAAGEALSTAEEAEEIAKKIADGTYSGGTFISGTSIYSPEIYGNTISVLPDPDDVSNTDGGFSVWGYFSGSLREMFKIQYHDGGGAPITNLTAWGVLRINTPTIADSIEFEGSSDSPCLAYGHIDFTNAEVTGLSSSGGVAVFG